MVGGNTCPTTFAYRTSETIGGAKDGVNRRRVENEDHRGGDNNARYLRTRQINRQLNGQSDGPKMENIIPRENHIYGLEMMALLAVLMTSDAPIEGLSVVFYIDNNNALEAVVKNSATPIVIQSMTFLIWHRISDLRISALFERVPSKRNISDLHTRKVRIPHKTKNSGAFKDINQINTFGNNKSNGGESSRGHRSVARKLDRHTL